MVGKCIHLIEKVRAADNLHFRLNNALAQTFTVDGANELTNVSRAGTFTLGGAMPAPAAGISVNGNAAQSYGDFTFAAPSLSLANGANTFTIAATNIYGVATNNTLAVNLPQSVNLAYDNNGNLTNDGTRAFGYNTENQLTNITVAGQWSANFVYDGLGRRRITRQYSWNGSGWTQTNEIHYLYDGYLPIQERDTNNNVLLTYTRGLDLSGDLWDAGGIGGLLARTDANGSTFYHSDGAGNITALMDSNEVVVARYMYGPFGKPIGQWGPMANVNEMQFASMPRDNLSGLSIYPFRAYEPNFQRWLNQDPIQEWGGINLYRPMDNSPMNWVDPIELVLSYDSPVPLEGGGRSAGDLEGGGRVGGEVTAFETANQDALLQEALRIQNEAAAEKVAQEQFEKNVQQDGAELMKEQENLEKELQAAKQPKKPTSPAAKVSCPPGGRKGGADTRALNQKIAQENEALGAKHTAGGNLPEQYYPNPDGERDGGRYSDIENTFPDGTKIVTQTVDTDSNGDPTEREVDAALDIYDRLQEGDQLVLVPKPR